jgi:hypothetical protein
VLGDYVEAGAIVFLFTTVEWLETLACTKASAGMSPLMSMVPPKVVLAGIGEVVSVRDVRVGTVITVRAEEVVPVSVTERQARRLATPSPIPLPHSRTDAAAAAPPTLRQDIRPQFHSRTAAPLPPRRRNAADLASQEIIFLLYLF